MNKQGFSLVELSIVLVIIGILMGMTLKGKSLIFSAKLRKDVNKLVNIQRAMYTYISDNDRSKLPRRSGGARPEEYEEAYFIDNGILTRNDLYSEINESSYLFVGCKVHTNNHYEYLIDGAICARMSHHIYMKPVLACNMEKILDDSSFDSGLGRTYGGGIVGDARDQQPPEFFIDCNIAKAGLVARGYDWWYIIAD